MYPEWDSNPHAQRQQGLNLSCTTNFITGAYTSICKALYISPSRTTLQGASLTSHSLIIDLWLPAVTSLSLLPSMCPFALIKLHDKYDKLFDHPIEYQTQLFITDWLSSISSYFLVLCNLLFPWKPVWGDVRQVRDDRDTDGLRASRSPEV